MSSFNIEHTGGLFKSGNYGDVRLPDGHRAAVEDIYGENIDDIFLTVWEQALSNSSMPVDFANRHTYKDGVIWVESTPYMSTFMEGIDHDFRRSIISNTPQHKAKKNISDYGRRFSPDCLLDKNIMQTLDAELYSSVLSNALAIVNDKYAWIVNKFPYNIGGAIILPIDHDDLTNRASYDKDTEKWTKKNPSQTRGAIISKDYLNAIVHICDEHSQTAHRNHALDGMSIPMHDHFKTAPDSNPGFKVIDNIINYKLSNSDSVSFYMGKNTPFDTLCITGGERNDFINEVQRVLELLETNDEVYTVIYHKGHFLITPRKKELYGDGNKDAWTGSTVGAHGIELPSKSPKHYERVLKYSEIGGEYSWKSKVDIFSLKSEGLVRSPEDHKRTMEKVKVGYSIIPYGTKESWGNGNMLKSNLVPVSVYDMYMKLVSKQDKRNDKGHCETVTYLTCAIADLLNVHDDVKEIAALSAVFHDAGYDDIENVTEKFASITRDELSDDKADVARAKKLDREIRIEHQENAARLVEKYLAGHRLKDEIKRIVLDHDTRVNSPRSMAEAIMRDADWLARVTKTNLESMIKRFGDQEVDMEKMVHFMERQLIKGVNRGFYLFECSKIALLEMSRSLADPPLPIAKKVLDKFRFFTNL